MEFVPSVSRSSGLEDGGDALKGVKMQEDYRGFVEDKLQRYWAQYPIAGHMATPEGEAQRNAQSNILILFRKLREGLMASKRVDGFALEVYETSLHLSILFRAPAQTTSIISQLLPQGRDAGGLYRAATSHTIQRSPISLPKAEAEMSLEGSKPRKPKPLRQIYRPPHTRRGQPHQASPRNYASPTDSSPAPGPQTSLLRHGGMPTNYKPTALISLLHTLLHFYPSQSAYMSELNARQHFRFGDGGSGTYNPYQWLKLLSTALAARNYARIGRLTRSPEVEGVYRSLDPPDSPRPEARHAEVRRFAFKCLVEDLRVKVREVAWAVLATAYRELDVTQSADWLLRGLMIDSDLEEGDVRAPGGALTTVERWLGRKGETEVKRKEGVEGRWILCRGRVR